MARLFVALDLPEEARKALSKLLPGGIPSLKKTPSERLHLTMRFVGEAEESNVSRALEDIKIPENLALTIRGTELFGSSVNPRVLFAGVETSPPLIRLQSDIESALLRAGFAPEKGPWQPHITLARVRHSRAINRIERGQRDETVERFLSDGQSLQLKPIPLDGFKLFASETLAGMLHYREIAFFAQCETTACDFETSRLEEKAI